MRDKTENLGLTNRNDIDLRQLDQTSDRLDFDINQGDFDNKYRGAGLAKQISDSLIDNGTTGLKVGTQYQNAPLDYQTQYNDYINRTAGQGGAENSTATGPAQRSDPATAIAGGAALAKSAYDQYGRRISGSGDPGIDRYTTGYYGSGD